MVSLMVSACARATGEGGRARGTAARWGASVTASAGPVAGDVLFVGANGTVVAEAPIANGRYELAAQPAATLALFRFESPVVGVREVEITGAVAPSIALGAADLVALRAAIELPLSVRFDWVDLWVTPIAPTQAPMVVVWADAQGSLRAAMTTHHLTSPTTELAVLRGSYRIDVSREVDAPPGSGDPVLALDHAQLGTRVIAATVGGATVPLDAPADVRLVMRVVPPGASSSGAERKLCHPIVNGCGCAYQCGQAMRAHGPGRWLVAHDLQDGRLDEATMERMCFDAAGHASPTSNAAATRCMDVFRDQTACGGECIPTAQYLGCHAQGDRCVP
jgi:hypothetical protein